MSDISINIPLSLFGENADLNNIVKDLRDLEALRTESEANKARYNALVTDVQAAGRNLTLILNEVEGFDQVRALRNFAQGMTDMGATVRPMP